MEQPDNDMKQPHTQAHSHTHTYTHTHTQMYKHATNAHTHTQTQSHRNAYKAQATTRRRTARRYGAPEEEELEGNKHIAAGRQISTFFFRFFTTLAPGRRVSSPRRSSCFSDKTFLLLLYLYKMIIITVTIVVIMF